VVAAALGGGDLRIFFLAGPGRKLVLRFFFAPGLTLVKDILGAVVVGGGDMKGQ
jgi:hypothetical protein